jgi:hypothetical protein
MAKFDQRGQSVVNQQNADQIFNGVSSPTELAHQLRVFSQLLSNVDGAADDVKRHEAQNLVNISLVEMEKKPNDKSLIQSSLKKATEILKGAVSLGGLYEAAVKASELASKLM